MRTRRKIHVDRLVGRPLAGAANLVARGLGRVLRRDHSVDPDAVRTIAVVKFVGMGSILHATPLLRGLVRRFPNARIVFVTARGNRRFVEHLANVDEILCVDDRGPLRLLLTSLATLGALARRRVDLYFDLEVYSAYACLMALLSLARNRYGLYRTSVRFKLGIYTHALYFNTHKAIRELYGQLGAAAGVPAEREPALGPLRVSDEARRSLDARWQQLAGATAGEAPIVFNPNASDLLEERRWPAHQVVAAVEKLVRRGHLVAFSGAPDEAPYVAELTGRLSSETRERVVNTAGELTLPELLALLERARCVVSNDTGPMHMAIALGRPTVCLFGPCHPAHYGVRSPDVEILYEPVFCSPCVHHTDEPPCAGDNVCMKRIEPDAVLAAVERLLSRDGAAATAVGDAAPGGSLSDSAGSPLGIVVRESVPSNAARACEVCGGRSFGFRLRQPGFRVMACEACGLERVDPAPSESELDALYGRSYYDAWGLGAGERDPGDTKRATFRGLLDSLRRPLAAGDPVLDCGAATGFLMQVAAERGLEPYGVERSEFGAGEIARRFGAERVHRGELDDARLERAAPDGFAAVFMLDFLEHVRDPAAVLARAHALLRPDGLLVLTTPDRGSWSRRLMGSRWTHYKLEHLFYFSRRNLVTLLERAGFEVVDVRAARKALTLRYAYHQFETYPHWLLTRLLRGAQRLLPDALLDRPIPVSIGEMQVQALRRPGPQPSASA